MSSFCNDYHYWLYFWRNSSLEEKKDIIDNFIKSFANSFHFFGYFVYQTSYHTTPDSLEFFVHTENETYFVEGRWKESFDANRFPSDFLVFYVPENKKSLQRKTK